MKTPMQIRSFEIKDTSAVVDLWQACQLIVPWNDPYADIKRKLTVGSELFLVGEYLNTIVATAMGGYDGHRGWINYLAVSPEHRRNGWGQQLIRHLEATLLGLGCPKINLQIRASNKDVIAFYRDLGFTTDNVTSMGKRLISDEI